MWIIDLANRIVTSPSPAPISKIRISLPFGVDRDSTLKPPAINRFLNCSSDRMNIEPRFSNLQMPKKQFRKLRKPNGNGCGSYPLMDVWVIKNPRNSLAAKCHNCSQRLPDNCFACSNQFNVMSSGFSSDRNFDWYFSGSDLDNVYHCEGESQKAINCDVSAEGWEADSPISCRSLPSIGHYGFYQIEFSLVFPSVCRPFRFLVISYCFVVLNSWRS